MADAADDRRTFIKKAAAAGAGLGLAGSLGPAAYGRAASRGSSANDTVVIGVMGVNSRGNALAKSFARAEGAEVGYICDVDERAIEATIADLTEPAEGADAPLQERRPEGAEDVRRVLDDDAVDALAIAAPDHWHAPATLMALDAGKHVYVEKPCSHNPAEGEMLVQAQEQYPDRAIQMGNQQRSSPRSMEIIQRIHGGDVIGDAYYARAWYSNDRGPLNLKRPAEVPNWLNYELWQGPAPRREYAENLVHYNWHWRWHWGTGEILNNGTHEIDVCRWALGVDFPTRAVSSGGRYHYDDDWEAFDTQIASFDFEGEKTIAWEGRSCNPTPLRGTGEGPGADGSPGAEGQEIPGSGGRGASIHGTEGTVVIDRSGYVVYDMDNNIVEKSTRGDGSIDQTNTVGGGDLTDRHTANFVRAIQGQAELRSPITEVRPSVLLCHLGNIAQRTGGGLQVDPSTGHPTSEAAMQLWSREYAPEWKPKV